MSKELSIQNQRLKYGSKFINLKITSKSGNLVDVEVITPSAGMEKRSFFNISREISKLVYSGVRRRPVVVSAVKKMVNVDHEVRKFMIKIINNNLPLED